MKNKKHEDYLEDFKKEHSEAMNKFPQLEQLFINMFNYGYSCGAEWMLDNLKIK